MVNENLGFKKKVQLIGTHKCTDKDWEKLYKPRKHQVEKIEDLKGKDMQCMDEVD